MDEHSRARCRGGRGRRRDGGHRGHGRDHGRDGGLADDIGAPWYDLENDDPARAIADFARRNQITQIVIGSSQRSRWQQLAGGGSNVNRVLREAGQLGIDVHVIALRKPQECDPDER